MKRIKMIPNCIIYSGFFRNFSAVFLMMLIFNPVVSAQTSTSPRPDSGSTLLGIQASEPEIPNRKDEVMITIPKDNSKVELPSDVMLRVSRFRIVGNTVLDTASLTELLNDFVNREIPLSDLQTATERITEAYEEEGYFLSRAILPAQEISEDQGEVIIQVLEGKYGQVSLENESLVKSSVIQNRLSELDNGDVVNIRPLEESLLLIEDLAGIAVKTRMSAGSQPGTADLLVLGEPTKRFSGVVSVDDQGTESTGKYRLRVSSAVDSPLGLGDTLSVSTLFSDENQLFFQSGYDVPVTPRTKFSMSASRMEYELSGDFKNLDASGISENIELGATYNIIRSRTFNLLGRLTHSLGNLEDTVGVFDSMTHKKTNNSVISLSGDLRDDLWGGGANMFSLSFVSGNIRLVKGNFAEETPRGAFTKLELTGARLQNISNNLDLYLALRAQVTPNNLDSSEKIMLSGVNGVRAYPLGEFSGDEGALFNMEFRYRLLDEWQLRAFADSAYSKLINKPFTDDDNYRTLSGIGVGASWRPSNGFLFKVDIASRTGEAPLSSKKNGMFLWSSGSWYF